MCILDNLRYRQTGNLFNTERNQKKVIYVPLFSILNDKVENNRFLENYAIRI